MKLNIPIDCVTNDKNTDDDHHHESIADEWVEILTRLSAAITRRDAAKHAARADLYVARNCQTFHTMLVQEFLKRPAQEEYRQRDAEVREIEREIRAIARRIG